MSQEIRFEILGKLEPDKRSRSSRFSTNHYTPTEVVHFKNYVGYLATQAAPPVIWKSAVEVEIKFFFVKPDIAIKKKRLYPTVPPDWDNLAKAICDACNKIIYLDDKQIIRAKIEKLYGEHSKAEVIFREVLE